jgi:rhodanese-related sulfurtransferase
MPHVMMTELKARCARGQSTGIVVYCHAGDRSAIAAAFLPRY